ncbi:sulfite exporter TauE/SafE family protein [Haloferula sp. A504]|uniref:sulfite exporter TauE/SafE family protein n=1 Tax=Haloferula sp. A504 TaxID=3373601 RepID=UPI0031C0225C|nr:sulfite exporter TauE/SafE family protein [Verrucomicrobiaceae bacterium E54]
MDTTTIFGALAVGLATSLHCAGMCGPIACGVGTLAKSESERLTAASLYHASRLASYAVIGAICGAVGKEPLHFFFDSPAVLLPWALVVALLLLATGIDKKIPRPKILNRLTARARLKATKFSAAGGASAMGLLTPFLPCGPLYAVFIALMASGSAARGAEAALAFGLGTVPLLWLAQHQFHRLRLKLTPIRLARLQRGLALVTALLLAWRLHDTLPDWSREPTPAANEEKELPSCCH